MRILAIDTSTRALSLALAEGDFDSACFQVLEEKTQVLAGQHGETLAPQVEQILQAAGWQTGDLQEVVVGVGPGSYTGLRIGVTFAKCLAYALKIPVYRVSSLALMAAGVDQAVANENSLGHEPAEASAATEMTAVKESSATTEMSAAKESSEPTELSVATESSETSEMQAALEVNHKSETTKPGQGHWVIPIMDARRGTAYTGLYQRDRLFQPVIDDLHTDFAPWLESLNLQGSVTLVGTEIEAFEEITRKLYPHVQVVR